MDFLLEAYRQKQMQIIGVKRPAYVGLCEGQDFVVQRKAIGKAKLSQTVNGALRSVQLGNVVTQGRHTHWSGKVGCSCGAEKEAPHHRFLSARIGTRREMQRLMARPCRKC